MKHKVGHRLAASKERPVGYQETMWSYVMAQERIGETTEHRMTWLLKFVNEDLSKLSPGAHLALSDEIRVFGAPIKTGFNLFDLPEGKTVEDVRKSSIIRLHALWRFQGELNKALKDILSGNSVILEMSKVTVGGCLHPKTSRFEVAYTSHPLHLLKFRMLLDLEQVEINRIRQCQRGKDRRDQALGVEVCERWFFAQDLRLKFCSPECGRKGRWARHWKSNRKQINERRRKGE